MTEETVFARALETPAGERAAFLDRECAGNPDLRRRVEALLAADAQSHVPVDGTGAYVPAVGDGPTQTFGVARPEATETRQPAEFPGIVIAGKYTLVDVIGEGGMGSVWRAKQFEPVKRFVAVKLIKAGMDSKQVLARFEAERQALALMDHPNIAKVLDGGLHEHRPFFVMELVKGTPITEFCDANKLNPQRRLELFVQACQAIQHAHQKGIIHRDIKPSNVLVALYDDRPVVKVIDFGVAKATTGGSLSVATIDTGLGGVVGTPQYMSPEQATFNNLDIDTRSDVYALGVLLYELLTGSPPFSGDELKKKGFLEILRVVREEEPARPSTKLSTADALPSISANRGTEPKKLTGLLRNELDWIVMKALEKDRSRRYETANGFAADVQRYLAGEPVVAHPPGAGYRLKKFVRRHKGQVLAASVVAVSLFAGIVGTALGLLEAQKQTAEAKKQEGIARGEAEQKELARSAEQAQREAAERAATAEKSAREKEAEERKYAQAIAAFVKDDFLALTSVEGQLRFGGEGLDRETTLLQLLDRAAEKLQSRKDLNPRIEAELCWIVGVNYRGAGEAAKALPFLERATSLRRQVLGPDDSQTLQTINSLAAAYKAAGQHLKAVSLNEEALKARKAVLGLDHPDTLSSMNNLACCYMNVGRLDEALPLLKETLSLRKAILGPEHKETLSTMSNLAECYRNAGRIALSLPLLEQALHLKKKNLGPDHPETLTSMGNLANAYDEVGKFDLSVPLLEETHKLTRAKLGPDHPDTLTIMNNLATGYTSIGQFDKALSMLEATFKITKAKLGPDHLSTLATMHNLANTYRFDKKYDLALPLAEEMVKLARAKHGPEHRTTLRGMHNLALCYENIGKYDLALPLTAETLRLMKATLGPDHPETNASMFNLARCYQALKKHDLALPLLEASLQFDRAKRGSTHPHTINTIVALALCYSDVKQGEKAVPLVREFVAAKRKDLPPGSPALAGQFAGASVILLRAKQFAAAEEIVRESLTIRQKLEPNVWSTFHTQSVLGDALLGQKNFADAETMLVKGYEGLKNREKTIPAQAAFRIPEALDRLIKLYTATNKPDEVKKYRELRANYSPPKEQAPPPKAVK